MNSACRRAVYLTYRLPQSAWQAVREYRAIRVSRRTSVQGFKVIHYDNQADVDTSDCKIGSALQLIGSIDSRRLERMRADVEYIFVGSVGRAQYWTISHTCALEVEEVQHRSVATIALMLVHEATHARLNHQGIYPWPTLRTRLERRCIAEEKSFALRLKAEGFHGVEKLIAWLDTLYV